MITNFGVEMKAIIHHKNTLRFLLHIFFWISYYFVCLMLTAYTSASGKRDVLLVLTSLPLDIVITYVHLYWLLPKLLLKKKFGLFMILFIAIFIAVIIFNRAFYTFVQYPLFYRDPLPSTYKFWNLASMLYAGIFIYAIVFLAISIKMLKYWLISQQQRSELEIKNKESEIMLLRMQINPHFLFNTLNNINALINTNKNHASNSLVKLSEIMRYMLYEANVEKVELEKEIDYLLNYIELQKLRLVNPEIVELDIHVEAQGKKIAPMILIPFVENAFKHLDKENKEGKLQFELMANRKQLIFKASNLVSTRTKAKKMDTQGGIGLTNVKRRLELIYKDRFDLQIENDNKLFRVKLIIDEL